MERKTSKSFFRDPAQPVKEEKDTNAASFRDDADAATVTRAALEGGFGCG
jgi:hypothetical protein